MCNSTVRCTITRMRSESEVLISQLMQLCTQQRFRYHCLSEVLDLTRRYTCEPSVLKQIVWGTKARSHTVMNTNEQVIMQNLTIS